MIRRLDALADRVTDLLRYAKPRAPRLADVELRPVLENTIELLRRDAAMKNVQIEITGDDVQVRGDAEWLHEVLTNLLLNAAQAMNGRGTVRVAVDGANGGVITIRDEGPGIPAEQREQVFEPFFTTKRLGTGLGLAIVRRLMELQGGSVTLEGDSAVGATFVVRLTAR
jgi:signal transduction histidine kinase